MKYLLITEFVCVLSVANVGWKEAFCEMVMKPFHWRVLSQFCLLLENYGVAWKGLLYQ